MPLIPDPPFPKSQGDTLRSKDWNDAVNEIIRLDNAKVNRSGDHLTGPLSIDGAVGIGTTTPNRRLTIQGTGGTYVNAKDDNGVVEVLMGADNSGAMLSAMTNHDLQLRAGGNDTKAIVRADSIVQATTALAVGPFPAGGAAEGRLGVAGSTAELSFARRTLKAWPATPAAGDRFVWYNSDGTARLWTEVKGDLLSVDTNGNLQLLTGQLTIPKTSGSATFTNATYSNEASFRPGNLKLSLAFRGLIVTLPGQPPPPSLQYEFAIGHEAMSFFPAGTSFVKRFSINENGDLFCAGSKTGYVVDYFINAVGDTVEQGDVVVIAETAEMRYYGSNRDIPIPEVDLTDRAYDQRVCGIVAQFVSPSELPPVDFDPVPEGQKPDFTFHPLEALAADMDKQSDHRKVGDQQLGRMATLGAFAHCKVDADLAPIQAGDLLTTSPTRGHAQKVLDPAKALGAIVGKALASLPRGRGKIPVLVMLQ
jgi:hypothetical protein